MVSTMYSTTDVLTFEGDKYIASKTFSELLKSCLSCDKQQLVSDSLYVFQTKFYPFNVHSRSN